MVANKSKGTNTSSYTNTRHPPPFNSFHKCGITYYTDMYAKAVQQGNMVGSWRHTMNIVQELAILHYWCGHGKDLYNQYDKVMAFHLGSTITGLETLEQWGQKNHLQLLLWWLMDSTEMGLGWGICSNTNLGTVIAWLVVDSTSKRDIHIIDL